MCFSDEGYLPIGIHEMTWDELFEQFSFSPKRKTLLDGLKRAMEVLKQCGCTIIYIDGSFVTQKLEPNDYDACWEGDWELVSTNMTRIEPLFIDQKDLSTGRKGQKLKYGGEIFPAFLTADSKGTLYIDFFQLIRDSDNKKGIVAIKL
jgi:hypothetical protein